MTGLLKNLNNRPAGMHRLLMLMAILSVTTIPYVQATCKSEVAGARSISERIRKEWPLRSASDHKTRYVQTIADSLVRTIKARMSSSYFDWPLAPWHLSLVRDFSVNAYSIGNGQIYLTDGTFAFVSNEAELVAIIAHEIAHQLLGHFCQRTRNTTHYRIGSLVQVFDNNKEMEADALAIEILKSANFPSHAMHEIVKRLPVSMQNDTHKQTRIRALERQLRGITRFPFTSSPEFIRLKKTSS